MSSPGQRDPGALCWRVYVPDGRTVTLNARTDSVSADKTSPPRIPPNAIVAPDREAPNPIHLGPGEHVVTLSSTHDGFTIRPDPERSGLEIYSLRLDVVGDGIRSGKTLRLRNNDFRWFHYGPIDITHVELTNKIAKDLHNGRTLVIPGGKTFVLSRLREHPLGDPPAQSQGSKENSTANLASEVLVWVHPDAP
jgi:hypothetical protein